VAWLGQTSDALTRSDQVGYRSSLLQPPCQGTCRGTEDRYREYNREMTLYHHVALIWHDKYKNVSYNFI